LNSKYKTDITAPILKSKSTVVQKMFIELLIILSSQESFLPDLAFTMSMFVNLSIGMIYNKVYDKVIKFVIE